MNKYPEYIEVDNIKYKINTDFRIALECDKIVRDSTIGDYEKILAIIYKLLGEKALNDNENHTRLFNLCQKYLQCNKDYEDMNDEEEPSMDFEQDIGYIKASFMSDYNGMDLNKIDLHWWFFNDLLQGLTENSVLNRVRYIREEKLDDKKGEQLEKWKRMKQAVALKSNYEKSEKEKMMDNLFESQMRGE